MRLDSTRIIRVFLTGGDFHEDDLIEAAVHQISGGSPDHMTSESITRQPIHADKSNIE